MLSVGDRERGMVEICEEMRKDLAKYPEIKTFKVIEGGQEEGMGGQNAVDIEIYGFDFGRTDAVAAELAERMRKVKVVHKSTSAVRTTYPNIKLISTGKSWRSTD